MQNFVKAGSAITIPAPAAVSSGSGVLVGSLFGVAAGAASIGESVVIHTTGVYELPKESTDDITVGEAVFWDDANSRVTDDGTGNTLIGHAIAAAGNPSATVKVRLSS